METIRRYKKLLWFELLDVIESADPSHEAFVEFIDEFKMRLIESISEGNTFKIKAAAKNLRLSYENLSSQDPDFATEEQQELFQKLVLESLET